MENKYYTPSIEEFFVGFECEWQSKIRQESWNKQICDVDLVNIAYDSFEHSDIEEPFNEQFRVKYLDSSDIEELGFVLEPYFKDVDYFGYRKGNIRLYLLENDRIEITTEDKKFEAYYFLGVIKNKSELKKVLNMLNIK